MFQTCMAILFCRKQIENVKQINISSLFQYKQGQYLHAVTNNGN